MGRYTTGNINGYWEWNTQPRDEGIILDGGGSIRHYVAKGGIAEYDLVYLVTDAGKTCVATCGEEIAEATGQTIYGNDATLKPVRHFVGVAATTAASGSSVTVAEDGCVISCKTINAISGDDFVTIYTGATWCGIIDRATTGYIVGYVYDEATDITAATQGNSGADGAATGTAWTFAPVKIRLAPRFWGTGALDD